MSIGLLGRVLAILFAVAVAELAATTFLFERSQHFALRDDEAQRMAEHLLIARRVLDQTRPEARGAGAMRLATVGFEIGWSPEQRAGPASYQLNELRAQVLGFAPELGRANLRLFVPPLSSGASIAGTVELADHSTMSFRASHGSVGWSLTLGRLLVLLAPTLVLVATGVLMLRRLFRPLRALVRETTRVGVDDHSPVPEQGPSEVRALIHAFNTMHSRIQRLMQARTQALVAVTHDLRTPLARLRLRLDNAAIDEEERRTMGGDIDELSGLLRSLQDYLGGRDQAGARERIDLAAMVQTIMDNARDQGGAADYDGPESLAVMAYPVAIRRAIGNLVDNALHYGGTARAFLSRDGETALLRIEDDGPGIPPDRLEEALQPFVRIDTARQRNTSGMGLGLAIASDSIRREGGTLTLENRREGGLCVSVRLPLIAD